MGLIKRGMLRTKEWALKLRGNPGQKKKKKSIGQGKADGYESGRLRDLEIAQQELGRTQSLWSQVNFLRPCVFALGHWGWGLSYCFLVPLLQGPPLFWSGLWLSWGCDPPFSHHFYGMWVESLHISSVSKFPKMRVVCQEEEPDHSGYILPST